MYRSLNPKALGITGRQSEIIELALTYGFRGLELDVHDFLKRVEHRGFEHATRFIRSSQLKIGGIELPVRWRGEESTYLADVAKLEQSAESLVSIGAKTCHTLVLPGSDMPYHENFELHRRRLGAIAEALARHGIRLGVGFLAPPAARQDYAFQFIREAEPLVTLIKSVGSDNVGLMLDTWNWHFGGGTHEALRGLGGKGVASIYLAEAPADATLDSVTEEQRMLPNDQGPVNNTAMLGLLHELGYRGPVTLAPHPRCVTGRTRDAIVQHCGNAFDDIWRALGLSKPGRLVAASAEAE